jgi:hypothetical protein
LPGRKIFSKESERYSEAASNGRLSYFNLQNMAGSKRPTSGTARHPRAGSPARPTAGKCGEEGRARLQRDCARLKSDPFPGRATLTGERRRGSGRYTAGQKGRASVRAKPSTTLQGARATPPIS